jgi:calcium binding protein 39
MSFFFRGGSRQRPTPQEIVRSIKDSLVALDNKTGTKALDDAEKNILTLRHTLSGDGEVEPNQEQVLQGRKDLVHCWSILLRQKVDESYCCVQYIENHVDLLDFLVVCYKNLEIALNCGNMLRECIKYPTLAKYILESSSFELFFQYVELPNFDIASDALNTFKDLLTKHEDAVSEFLSSHYEQFFGLYTRLLSSTNYVTRRQSVKFLSEFLLEAPNAQIMKRYILEVHYLNIMIGLLKVLQYYI